MEAKLYKAIAIATKAHEGQKDKSGNPYIEHPLRVAVMADTIEKKIVAVLHDVVEDTDITLEYIYEEFGPRVMDAVNAITHRSHEPRPRYYERVKQNALAHSVKLLDIMDNLCEERLATLDEQTQVRLRAKYAMALEILLS